MSASQMKCVNSAKSPPKTSSLGRPCNSDDQCAEAMGEKCGSNMGNSHHGGEHPLMPSYCAASSLHNVTADQRDDCICQAAASNHLCSAPQGQQGTAIFMERCCGLSTDQSQRLSSLCAVSDAMKRGGAEHLSDTTILTNYDQNLAEKCGYHSGGDEHGKDEHGKDEHGCSSGYHWCPSFNQCLPSEKCPKPGTSPNANIDIDRLMSALQKRDLHNGCTDKQRKDVMDAISMIDEISDSPSAQQAAFTALFCAFASPPQKDSRMTDKSEWNKLADFLKDGHSIQTIPQPGLTGVHSDCLPNKYYKVKGVTSPKNMTKLLSMFLNSTEIDTLVSADKDGKIPIPSKADFDRAEKALLGDGEFTHGNMSVYKHAILAGTIALLYPCGGKSAEMGNTAVNKIVTAYDTDTTVQSHSPKPTPKNGSPTKKKGFNWMLFGIITGTVVIVILIIVGFVIIRHNRRNITDQ